MKEKPTNKLVDSFFLYSNFFCFCFTFRPTFLCTHFDNGSSAFFLCNEIWNKTVFPVHLETKKDFSQAVFFPMEQPTFRQLFLYEPNKSYCLRISLPFSSGIFHINFILLILSFFFLFIHSLIHSFRSIVVNSFFVPSILFCDINF